MHYKNIYKATAADTTASQAKQTRKKKKKKSPSLHKHQFSTIMQDNTFNPLTTTKNNIWE